MSKKVTIKSIRFINFKGERDRVTVFNDDVTTIAGANGLGKSRHFDALCWCLFGKDAKNRADYELKTIVDGEPLHKVDCGVEIVLNVDGEEIRLRRMLNEKWVKPRGQVEQVFQGDQTECYWNDTPVKVSDYKKRVADIIDETIFKMVTNPAFFVSQDWKIQREHLFRIAGTMTDEEVAQAHPEFADLLEVLGNKSLTDYKAEINATLKRLRKDLGEIPTRIDQTTADMNKICIEDFIGLDDRIADVERQIEDIDWQLSDRSKAAQDDIDAYHRANNELSVKRLQLSALETNARVAADDAARTKNGERAKLVAERDAAMMKAQSAQDLGDTARKDAAAATKRRDDYQKQVDDKRAEWYRENEREYDGSETCPCCGQRLPEDVLRDARDKFAQAKRANLDRINDEGKRLSERVQQENARIEEANRVAGDNDRIVSEQTRVADELKARIDAMPVAVAEYPANEEIPGWVALHDEIVRLEQSITAPANKDSVADSLRQRKGDLSNQRDELKRTAVQRDNFEKLNTEITRLEEEGKRIGQEIADYERVQYTIAQFTKTKITDAELRINGMFRMVTFRLFDYTIDGNEFECCVPLINGVPFGTANTASQVNAGLDIINVLCRAYDVYAPIFIDNRESVNDIIPVESQVINLVVTTDPVLTVK